MYINGDDIEVINYIETHPIFCLLRFPIVEASMDVKYSKTISIKRTSDYGDTKKD